MPELVRLEHYGFTYPQQTRPALSDVELTIRDGEFWVLCGTSGCGVRDAVAGTVRGGVGGVRETGKTQLSDADAAFEGSKIGFGSVYLIKSHAVADEVEYVFWRLCRSGTEGNGKE